MSGWALLAFAPAAFLMAMTPGASNLLAFANGASAGVARAARAVAGRILAYAGIICMVAFGLGALLEAWEGAFLVIKWGGVVYLAWLAWRLWTAPAVEARPVPALMRREFLTGAANPKAYVLFTAFLPQFAEPGPDFARQMLMLGAVYLGFEMLAATIWAGAGAGLGRLGAGRARLVNRVSGGLMALAALWLAKARVT